MKSLLDYHTWVGFVLGVLLYFSCSTFVFVFVIFTLPSKAQSIWYQESDLIKFKDKRYQKLKVVASLVADPHQ